MLLLVGIILSLVKNLVHSKEGNCSLTDMISKETCYACIDSYFSLKESPMFKSPFNINECIPKSNQTKMLEIFVSDKKCSNDSKCDGSKLSPMDDLLKAFEKINNESFPFLYIKISLYLLGDQHFILEKDIKLANSTKNYLRRRLISLSISTYLCSMSAIVGCKKDLETTTINVKTNQFFIFISGTLSMKNIIINGADTPLENRTTNVCYSNKSSCCYPSSSLTGCYSGYTTKQYLDTNSSWGLITAEILDFSVNFTGYPFPIITIENCQFLKITTVFPSETARFGGIIKSFENYISISLLNVSVLDCTLLNGVITIKKSTTFSWERAYSSVISFNILTIKNYDIIVIKAVTKSIFIFEYFIGRFIIDYTNLTLFGNSNKGYPYLFIFKNSYSTISMGKLFISGSDYIGFMMFNGYGSLDIADITFKLIKNTLISFFDYGGSALRFGNLTIDSCIFNQTSNTFLRVTNLNSIMEISSLLIKLSQNITFYFKGVNALITNATVLNITSNSTLMDLYNSSLSFEYLKFYDSEVRQDAIFVLNSYNIYFRLKLVLLNADFRNIIFKNKKMYICFFSWPLSNIGDTVIMKNLKIWYIYYEKPSVNDYDSISNIYFFKTYFCDFLEIRNISVSKLVYLRICIIHMFDLGEITLTDSSFVNIYYNSLYIFKMSGWLDESTIVFQNLTFENFTQSFPLLYNEGNNIFYFENITLLNFSYSECKRDCTTFIIMNKAIIIKNVSVLECSNINNHLYIVRFFKFLSNSLVSFENCSFITNEKNLNFRSVQILICEKILDFRIVNLYAKNLDCNRNKIKGIGGDRGLLSFSRSEDYLIYSVIDSGIELTNITIENCKYCKYGILGVDWISTISMINIFINKSFTQRGGALAILYGTNVSLVNITTIDNEALQIGGAIYIKLCEQVLTKNFTSINSIAEFGGTLYLKSVKNYTAINQYSFNSSSRQNGGFLLATETVLTITNGCLVRVISQGDGGAIFFEKGSIRSISSFSYQEGMTQSGGFIYARMSEFIQIYNITIKNCSAIDKGVSLYLDDIKFLSIQQITYIGIESGGYSNLYIILRKEATNYLIENIYSLNVEILQLNFIFLISLLQEIKFFSLTITNGLFLDFEGVLMILEFQRSSLNQIISLRNITLDGKKEYNRVPEPDSLFSLSNICLLMQEIYLINLKFARSGFYFREINAFFERIFFFTDHVWNPVLKDCYLFDNYKSQIKIKGLVFEGKSFQNFGLSVSGNTLIFMESINMSRCYTFWDSCIKAYDSQLQIKSSILFKNSGLTSGVINLLNSNFELNNCSFFYNSYLITYLANIHFIFQELSTNIVISGTLENKESTITNSSFMETSKGIIICLKNAKAMIMFSEFYVPFSNNNIVKYEIKAISGLNSDLKFIASSFVNFSSKLGGSISLEQTAGQNSENVFAMRNCLINNSVSYFGGGFLLAGYKNIVLENNFFLNCKALKNEIGMYGSFGVGLILGLTDNCLAFNSTFIVFGNRFVNNTADLLIANIFSCPKISTPDLTSTISSNIFSNNVDSYNFTEAISFFPLRIKIFILDKSNKKNTEAIDVSNNKSIEITSGNSFDFKIVLTDYLGNVIIFDDESRAEIEEYPDEELTLFIITNKKSDSKSGVFLFENLIINVDPSKEFKIRLRVYLKFEKIFPVELSKFNVATFEVQFYSRPCRIGELYIPGDQSCLKCPRGKYSIQDPMAAANKELQRCHICPDKAVCPGGALIVPIRGYWRSSNTSTIIMECLSKYSCLGFDNGYLVGEEVFHGKCLEHNFGPFCYICENGYARFSSKDVCKTCSSEIWVYIKFSLIVIGVVSYLIVQIRITFKLGQTSYTGILLKMMLTHIQQISLISLVDLGWTPDFKNFFAFQEYFSLLLDDFLPIECVLFNFGFNKLSQKIIVSNILPILVSIIVFFLWIILLLSFKNLKSRKCLTFPECFEAFNVTSLIVIVLLFPDILKKCLALFNCIDIYDSMSTRVLLYSPDVVCWEKEHLKFVYYCALPGIITWGFFAPVFIAYHLKKHSSAIKDVIRISKEDRERNIGESSGKKSVNRGTFGSIKISISSPQKQIIKEDYTIKANKNSQELNIFSENSTKSLANQESFENISENHRRAFLLKFLYKGYSEKYYYWEEFMFFKKFTLISISCVSDLFPSALRGMVLIILFSFFLIIQTRLNPFETSYLNKAELFSLLTTFLIAIIGAMMFTPDLQRIAIFLFILVILLNSCFFLFWLYLLLRETSKEFTILKKFLSFLTFKKRLKVIPTISLKPMQFKKSKKSKWI